MEKNYNRYKYTTANPLYYSLLRSYAFENRNNQTTAEELLWNGLSHNQLGVHFRRQHIIGCYIADFVCLKAKLIIEVDGGYHSQSQQEQNDILRTEDLGKMGFEVMRFKNEEITSNLSPILDSIFNKVVSKL